MVQSNWLKNFTKILNHSSVNVSVIAFSFLLFLRKQFLKLSINYHINVNMNDVIYLPIERLWKSSNKKVNVKCDICDNVKLISSQFHYLLTFSISLILTLQQNTESIISSIGFGILSLSISSLYDKSISLIGHLISPSIIALNI